MPDLTDADWLRSRLEAGATVNEIASEVGRTDRGVRMALRRHSLPMPRELRNARIEADVDLDAVFDKYRRGMPVATIAAEHQVDVRWIERRIHAHQVVREVAVQRARRRSRFPELDDPAWLRSQLAHSGLRSIARRLGTDASNVRAALRRNGIPLPSTGAAPIELAAAASTRPSVTASRPGWRGRLRTHGRRPA